MPLTKEEVARFLDDAEEISLDDLRVTRKLAQEHNFDAAAMVAAIKPQFLDRMRESLALDDVVSKMIVHLGIKVENKTEAEIHAVMLPLLLAFLESKFEGLIPYLQACPDDRLVLRRIQADDAEKEDDVASNPNTNSEDEELSYSQRVMERLEEINTIPGLREFILYAETEAAKNFARTRFNVEPDLVTASLITTENSYRIDIIFQQGSLSKICSAEADEPVFELKINQPQAAVKRARMG